MKHAHGLTLNPLGPVRGPKEFFATIHAGCASRRLEGYEDLILQQSVADALAGSPCRRTGDVGSDHALATFRL